MREASRRGMGGSVLAGLVGLVLVGCGPPAAEADDDDTNDAPSSSSGGSTSGDAEGSSSSTGDGEEDASDSGEASCNARTGTYGNCLADLDPLRSCGADDSICITNSARDVAVCSWTNCQSDCECPAAPDGVTAEPVCKDLGSDGRDCVLDCSDGQTCPDGMECAADICLHLVPSDRYLSCEDSCSGPNDACARFTDDEGPEPQICASQCTTSANCPTPEGSESPAVCLQGATASLCFLNCDGGAACPSPDMMCLPIEMVDGLSVCVYPGSEEAARANAIGGFEAASFDPATSGMPVEPSTFEARASLP